jgi:hypothetical protein
MVALNDRTKNYHGWVDFFFEMVDCIELNGRGALDLKQYGGQTTSYLQASHTIKNCEMRGEN